MRQLILCPECMIQQNGSVPVVGDINSELVVIGKCKNGHTIIVALAHDLFDILYTSAVSSFYKGCYSESVLSFSASLERAFEVLVKCYSFTQHKDIELTNNFWKEISKQSERQLGAFCLAYSNITKNHWKADNEMIKFRNKVVHQGYIATSKESAEYAEYITTCLSKIIQILKSNFNDEHTQIYFNQKEKAAEFIKKFRKDNKDAIYSGMSQSSLLKINLKDYENITFEEALKIYNKSIGRYDI